VRGDGYGAGEQHPDSGEQQQQQRPQPAHRAPSLSARWSAGTSPTSRASRP
jgi:hypothetical protein